jgi:hypothetical protein
LIVVFFVILAFAGIMLAAALAGLLNLLFAFLGGSLAWSVTWRWPMAVMLIPLAGVTSLLLGVWFFWRVIGGFIRALDEKPY